MLSSFDLHACVGRLHSRFPQHDPDVLAEAFDFALQTIQASVSAGEAVLMREVKDVAQTLAAARAEIVALGADDIRASHIPSATDELDAIVAHTAAATDSILASCEQLDEVSGKLDSESKQIVQGVLTQIFEACSFQDITGQRVTKIVSTLKIIEVKVAHMLGFFTLSRLPLGDLTLGETIAPSLLNGPQLSAVAMDQADIDALMASLD